MKNYLVLVYVVFILLQFGFDNPVHAQNVVDGDFADWTLFGIGNATASVETSGGNPGSRINITTVSGQRVWGMAVKNDFVSVSDMTGKGFSLSLDVDSGPGSFGLGQGVQLLVLQGGRVYATELGFTGAGLNWEQLDFSGRLEPENFMLMVGDGPNTPDFSGATETRFGFSGWNQFSGTLTNYYDNFSIAFFDDSDGDGLLDNEDNCIETPNADQRDTDADGIGSACDADLNNDCVVNVVDLGLLRQVFFSDNDVADFNGDGVVNTVDLGLMRFTFLRLLGRAV